MKVHCVSAYRYETQLTTQKPSRRMTDICWIGKNFEERSISLNWVSLHEESEEDQEKVRIPGVPADT